MPGVTARSDWRRTELARDRALPNRSNVAFVQCSAPSRGGPCNVRWASPCGAAKLGRVLPIVAVQVAPAESLAATPTLEEQLLEACSAGLGRARCVPARGLAGETPHGIAIVSWSGAEHVSIEVGLADESAPAWISRALDFEQSDPQAERWRAVGFTIALLADDPRFWPEAPPPSVPEPTPIQPDAVEPPTGAAGATESALYGFAAEVRALTGTGLVSGPWRWGAELRLVVPVTSALFLTGGVDYALAEQPSLDVRWFDVSLGAGLFIPSILGDLDARVRLELLGENVAIRVERGGAVARNSAWVPGVSLGGDVLYALGERWQMSARADVFWLDGYTGIRSAGQEIAAAAGAGVLLGLGAGHRF